MMDELELLRRELAEAKITINKLANRILVLEEQLKEKENNDMVSFKNKLNLK